jgi:MFS transporter, DHA1 family, multidrug resistance protein
MTHGDCLAGNAPREACRARILAGVAAAAFLGPFSQTVYAPSLPELGTFFHVNSVMANLTISLFTAILALSNFVVGPMADRWGRRAILLPGLIVFSLGSLLCLFAASYSIFLAGRVLQAIGISTALLIAPTVIGDIYPPQERAAAMGVFQTMVYLGPVFGPVVGGLIATYLHWQWAFALLAAAGIAAWLYNRSRLVETLPRGVVATRITPRTFRRVMANRSAFSIMVLGFSQFFGYYVFLVFLPTLLSALFTQSASSSEGFFFVPLTAGILGGISLGGRWQKHWGRARIVSASSFGIGLSVLLFWLALSAQLVTIPLLLAFLLAYGLLLGCSLPVQSTILVNLFQHEKATAVGTYNFFRFTGAAIGPIAGGVISLAYGVNAVFLTLGILLLLAAWVVRHNLSDPFDA